MTDRDDTEQLPRILIQLNARSAFPEEALRNVIAPGDKQRVAYNLADGTKSQGYVAKVAKIDVGNFSRTVGRWLDAGVLFKLGEGREARLLHLYPVSKLNSTKKPKT